MWDISLGSSCEFNSFSVWPVSFYQGLYLSHSLFVCSSLYLSFHSFVFIDVCICTTLYLLSYTCIHLPFQLYIFLSFYCQLIHLSIRLSVYLCMYLYLFLHLSDSFSLSLKWSKYPDSVSRARLGGVLRAKSYLYYGNPKPFTISLLVYVWLPATRVSNWKEIRSRKEDTQYEGKKKHDLFISFRIIFPEGVERWNFFLPPDSRVPQDQ